jgi:protoporphyrin/coproporphyrin ferrochelatase
MLKLRDSGCEHILVVPMYPQYASSTTATVVDEATRVAGRMRNQPALRFIKRFHTDPCLFTATRDKISALWQAQGRPQKLVMSFHGLPRQCVDMGDPYCQRLLRDGARLGRFIRVN